MKLLQCADLHLGHTTYGRDDPTTGLNSRLLDFAGTWIVVCQTAIEDKVDLVLFCGDGFKTRHPTPTEMRFFRRGLNLLASKGIPVILIPGNHDLPNAPGKANALDIFATDGVYISTAPEIIPFGDDVSIVTLPAISRSLFLSQDEYKNLSPAEANAVMAEKVEQILASLKAQKEPGVAQILMAHGTVSGAVFSSDQLIMQSGAELVIPANALFGFDYVALGHVHKHQELAKNVVYCGSLERIDFGEEREAKGFIMLEVSDGRVSWEFREIGVRRFVTLDLNETLLADVKDAIVRVKYQATEEQARQTDHQEIRRVLYERGAYLVADITPEIIRESRSRNESMTETLVPLEALDRYIESNEDYKPHRHSLLEKASELLKEMI